MPRWESESVPVIIDSVKSGVRKIVNSQGPGEDSSFRLITRCNYLSVECDLPKPGWALRVGALNLPFLMLGLTGVIHRPFDGEHFDTLDKIEDLFVRIEDEAGLLVNINDVWLPNFLFDRAGAPQKKGQVYRVDGNLFSAAFLYREGRLALGTFLERCHGVNRAVTISEKETAAFTDWHKAQIEHSIGQYPKNKALALHYREEGPSGPGRNSG